MTTAPTVRSANQIDSKTGLTLPLSKSLGSQELGQHRAMVAVEQEVLAKKFDRFGWDRDRGSAAHDRLVLDWMDALQDFPISEVRAACRAAVLSNPSRMPNEGHIRQEILKARARTLATSRPDAGRDQGAATPEGERVSADAATRILKEVGFSPRGFGK